MYCIHYYKNELYLCYSKLNKQKYSNMAKMVIEKDRNSTSFDSLAI